MKDIDENIKKYWKTMCKLQNELEKINHYKLYIWVEFDKVVVILNDCAYIYNINDLSKPYNAAINDDLSKILQKHEKDLRFLNEIFNKYIDD
jgi:alpha-N-acetylglucosamine transferase